MRDSRDVGAGRWLDGAREPDKHTLRQALDEAPRFAPSDVRQRRVWARISDTRPTHRAVRRAFARGALFASAVAALALVAIGVVSIGRPRQAQTVTSHLQMVTQTVTPVAVPLPSHREPPPIAPHRPTSSPAPASDAPELVRAGEGQHLTRALRQGAEAQLHPNAVLALDAEGNPEVREGRIAFKVAHQPMGEQFRVRAGAFTVVVVGTRFLVKVDGREVAVSVDEGVVEIWGQNHGQAPAQDRGQDRIARLVPGQSWSAGAVRGPHPLARPAAGDGTASSDLAEARAARASANPKRALAIYQRLSERRGPVGENALYEIGGIYRDQLHQPRQALAAWERYRSRYPEGLLRAEADLSIVDTLSGLGDGGRGRALGEALAFLKRYPRSERRGEVTRVAGDLTRSRGRCREAAELYGRVDATNASPTDADDAAFGRAACLVTLGDPEATSALQAYARERPAGRHRTEAVRLLGGATTTDHP